MNATTLDAVPGGHPLQPEVHALVRRGMWLLAVGVVPVVLWAALAPLASAVIAPAVVKVDLHRRPVQHAEGGLVREVRVRDGQQVAQGETLLVLGDVSVDADMHRWDARVRAERASIARLEAEQALEATLAFPPDLLEAARADGALAELLRKERALFDTRRSSLLGQTALLREQNEKVLLEGRSLAEQVRRAAESLQLQSDDLANNRKLLAEGYISPSRLSQLEAQVADYAVKLEERRSEYARAEQRLLDTQLRIRSLENEYRQQASDQLKATHARLAEIQQEQRKTGDAARRQVITAPAAGEVMGLRVTAPGAVIPPRETIAEIVPRQQKLVIEAMVRPEDIDHVRQGQAARIRFTAFAQRSTKLVEGTVSYVSADRLVDREAGSAYYLAHIETAPGSLAEQPHLRLVAGMPAEVFIEGAERTPLQYLFEPLVQGLARAARER